MLRQHAGVAQVDEPVPMSGITIAATVATARTESASAMPGPGDGLGPPPALAAAGVSGGVTLGGSGVAEDLDVAGPARYRLGTELGRGGIGVVRTAVDLDLRREVAIKIMAGAAPSARERLRFIEEAQVTGQLAHPNIVPVHDLGVAADGRPWFSMKRLQGRTVAELLAQLRRGRGGAWTLPRLVGVLVSVCHGVAYAHSRGVVHRDLKPANIMVGDYGEVWVCDWGLARVAGARRWQRTVPRSAGTDRHARGQRHDPGQRTLAGVVEGTPAYMAPEQARGDIAAIDERSDVYALGAILYEMLCLLPPVGGADDAAILAAAEAGRIIPPALRAPGREPPAELAAVAMKCLAHDPARRYAEVGALRADLERWLDGRSVSAKADTAWEALVKFVRRNVAVSAASAIAAVALIAVIGVFLGITHTERRKAEDGWAEARSNTRKLEQSLASLRQERQQREADQRRAAPALVESARRLAERRQMAAARRDAELAVDYDPFLPSARLVRAHLLLWDQDYDLAARELDQWLYGLARDDSPEDAQVRLLAGLAAAAARESQPATVGATVREPSAATLNALGDALSRQAGMVYAEPLYALAGSVQRGYRLAIERAWPGATRQGFSVGPDGRISLDGLAGRRDVEALDALRGLPIARLNLARTRVVDLAPLAGAPLQELDLSDTAVRELAPLAGAGLRRLTLSRTPVADLAPLAGMPIEELDLAATGVSELGPLAGMPLRTLRLAGTRVSALGPLALTTLTDLDLTDTPVADVAPLTGLRLTSLRLSRSRVADLTPLTGMPLAVLAIDRTPVTGIAPLAGAPLRSLAIAGSQVADLGPLAGAALSFLDLTDLPVSDLAPLARSPLAGLVLTRTQITRLDGLRGLRLTTLGLADTRVEDLGPLRGMPLAGLDLVRTHVSDLTPLRGMPLVSLALDSSRVSDLRPLAGLPLRELRLHGLTVGDVTPLRDAPLERLVIDAGRVTQGLDLLRAKPTLRQVGSTWDGSWQRVPSAREFWSTRR